MLQVRIGAALALGALISSVPFGSSLASSHMDAPLITLDDPANTTDVYAFISEKDKVKYLTTALAVYPFQEPGVGPNIYRFDDRVRYNIHVALDDDVARGRGTLTYQLRFKTEFANEGTILQAFLGNIENVFDDNQNLRQTYQVLQIDHRTQHVVNLGEGMVPPNNQGLVTPFYNQNDDGEQPAKEGARSEADLDRYTKQAIADLDRGHRAFAGQRDDGFYADIQSIFDLDFTFGTDPALRGTAKPFDSQGGFNVHTIVLNIPLSELGGARIAGVYASTDRRQDPAPGAADGKDKPEPVFVRVGRQGNPLFNEAFVAVADKDLYNQTRPRRDAKLFAQYALEPELATVLGLPDTNREDLAAIFIPDLIKVDLTTRPARLANQRGFHRLSVFGGDTLVNAAGEEVPGGWPNGRRFGDDVLDIGLLALGLANLVEDPAQVDVDRVTENDITFNDVFPYAATPHNGRVHDHHNGLEQAP